MSDHSVITSLHYSASLYFKV